MKIRTIISDITRDDLVNLFSTATYGSEYLDCSIPKGNYKGTSLEDENDCRENKWAKVLLSGKSIYVYDFYSEECEYGNLPHEWIESKQAMRYELTLEDLRKGLERAIERDDRDHLFDEVYHLMTEDDRFDICEAENLLQYIVFGEVVYG